MSTRAVPLAVLLALAVPLSVVIAAPAAASPMASTPGGSPFDFIPVESLESPTQVRDDGAVLIEVTADAGSLDAVEAAVAEVAEIVTVADDFGVVVAWAHDIDALTAFDRVEGLTVEHDERGASGDLDRVLDGIRWGQHGALGNADTDHHGGRDEHDDGDDKSH